MWGELWRVNGLQIPRASLQIHMHHYFPCAMALRLIT